MKCTDSFDCIRKMIMLTTVWLCLAIFLFAGQKAYSGAYKCVDSDGKTSFQALPCPVDDKSSAIELHETSDSVKWQGTVRRSQVDKLITSQDHRARQRVKRHHDWKEQRRQDIRYGNEQRLRLREVEAKEREAKATEWNARVNDERYRRR